MVNHLTDKQLLLDTKSLAHESHKITLILLHHLKEIENRKLFSDLGYPSLFNYIVEELGFTKASAARRINSTRLLIEMPEIQNKIEEGSLSLSNLSKAAETFRKEQITDKEIKIEILSAIENSSARECDRILSGVRNPIFETRNYHVINISVPDQIFERYEYLRGLMASLTSAKKNSSPESSKYLSNILKRKNSA